MLVNTIPITPDKLQGCLDELSGAEPRLQVAAYQLILDRRLGEYVLPPDWWVVGAGNNAEDGAIVYEMGKLSFNMKD